MTGSIPTPWLMLHMRWAVTYVVEDRGETTERATCSMLNIESLGNN